MKALHAEVLREIVETKADQLVERAVGMLEQARNEGKENVRGAIEELFGEPFAERFDGLSSEENTEEMAAIEILNAIWGGDFRSVTMSLIVEGMENVDMSRL